MNKNQSSVGSHTSSTAKIERTRQNPTYADYDRLQEIAKIHSTLQDLGGGLFSSQNDETPKENKNSEHKQAMLMGNSSSLFAKLTFQAEKRLFMMNHVILENHVITLLLYHVILILEFLQILFFVFFRLEVINEYAQVLNTSSTAVVNPASLNSTTSSLYASTDSEVLIEPIIVTLDGYFTFINFPVMILQKIQSVSEFQMMLFILTGVLFMFMTVALLMAEGMFIDAKLNGGLKEGGRLGAKIGSLLMTAYLTILQIPLVMMYLQGYQCEEDPDATYFLEVLCGTTDHIVMIAVSTVGLLVYTAFVLIQRHLFTERDFDSEIPWSSLDRRASYIKIALKVILPASFVFDKFAVSQGYIHLISCLLLIVIVYSRLYNSAYFHQSIQYMSILYESFLAWLFLTIGCHVLSLNQLTLTCLAAIFSIGLLLSLSLILVERRLKDKTLSHIKKSMKLESSGDGNGNHMLELYCFRIYQLIVSTDPQDKLTLQGLFSNHLSLCESHTCSCHIAAENLDRVKHHTKEDSPLNLDEESKYFNDQHDDNKSMISRLSANKASNKLFIQQESPRSMMDGFNLNPKTFGKEINPIYDRRFTNTGVQGPPHPVLQQQETHQSKSGYIEGGHFDNFKEEPKSALIFQRKQGGPAVKVEYVDKKTILKDFTDLSISAPIEDSNQEIKLSILYPTFDKTTGDFTPSPAVDASSPRYPEFEGGLKQQGHMLQHTVSFDMLSDGRFDYEEEISMVVGQAPPLRQRCWYQYLSFLIQHAIIMATNNNHRTTTDLRILCSFLEKSKLNNEFKAMFELMNCENARPSLQSRFFIFRMKVHIEQQMIVNSQKNQQSIQGNIDVEIVYKYEKLFQQYALREYLTAHATLSFWRQLLQRDKIDTQLMQDRGAQISRNYSIIQDLASELLKIYPGEIKFLCRYGIFLKQIVNNEYDAVVYLEKACQIYATKISKKAAQGPVNEQTLFGENTAGAIIIASASSDEIGTIIYANEEIKNVLGFSPKDLVGRNLGAIIPKQIAVSHNAFIEKYFITAQAKVINNKLIQFGSSSEGYLKILQVLIKVLPQLKDKIVFVGFMQPCEHFDAIETPTQPQYESISNSEYQYIMTDNNGYITGVTEGLNQELGLSSKFFRASDTFQYTISMSMICPEIVDMDIEEQLISMGKVLTFDTRDILNFIELEQLTAEEIYDVQLKIGVFQAFVQLKKIEYGSTTQVKMYRVIHLPGGEVLQGLKAGANLSSNDQLHQIASNNGPQSTVGPIEEGKLSNTHTRQGGTTQTYDSDQKSISDDLNNSSVSSTSSQIRSFNRVIQDFKKTLTERRTPSNLILLNRVMIFYLLVSICLTSVDFYYKQRQGDLIISRGEYSLQTQFRKITLMQLASNIRSLTDISNDLELNYYEGAELMKIDRYQYLLGLVQTQAQLLLESHDYLTKQRDEDFDENNQPDTVELRRIPVHLIDQQYQILTYYQPYRIALYAYLNSIQFLNGTSKYDLKLASSQLIQATPLLTNYTMKNNLSPLHQSEIFLLLNGLRGLREATSQVAEKHDQSNFGQNEMNSLFLSVMVTGIIITIAMLVYVLKQIWHTERSKIDILSLYALLEEDQIKQVHDNCDYYLENLTYEQGLSDFQPPSRSERKVYLQQQPIEQQQINTVNYIMPMMTQSLKQSLDHGPEDQEVNFAPGNLQSNYSILSEEEKEAQAQVEHAVKRRKQKRIQLNRKQMVKKGNFLGQHRYSILIKEAMFHIKDCQRSTSSGPAQKFNNTQLALQKQQSQKVAAILANNASIQKSKTSVLAVHPETAANTSQRQLIQDKPLKRKKNADKASSSSSEDNQHSNDSGEEDHHSQHSRQKGSHKRHSRKLKREAQIGEEGFVDVKSKNLQHRQQMFEASVNKKNWRFLGANTFFGVLLMAYFAYTYPFHQTSNTKLLELKQNTPIIIDRYSDLIMSYAFIKERIINNNSLISFNPHKSEFAHSINSLDETYLHTSLDIESYVTSLYTSYPAVLKDLVVFMKSSDSPGFCVDVIGEIVSGVQEKVSQSKNAAKKLKNLRKTSYSTQIRTVIAACKAASAGDLEQLKYLHSQGVNLNEGDYDKRTPLHVASSVGHYQSVQFLVMEVRVNINPVDRWGATPLCDSLPYPTVNKILKDNGAILGKIQPPYAGFDVKVTDDQFRLYYAAFFGDVVMMDNLRLLGWNVNGIDYDGRTALGIAASEGQLEVVKYLIAKGADLNQKDARGNDPLADASREMRTAVMAYLSSIINESLIRNYCSNYANGLLGKGMQYTFGIFHKKLQDLHFTVSESNGNYTKLLALLGGNKTSPYLEETSTNKTGNQSVSSTESILHTFTSVQELYLHKLLSQLETVLRGTYQSLADSLKSTAKGAFLAFLVIQVGILLVMRTKLISVLREEVYQSRGILNLIPEEFFEDNSTAVERLLMKLKN